jgi:hypothetical protein
MRTAYRWPAPRAGIRQSGHAFFDAIQSQQVSRRSLSRRPGFDDAECAISGSVEHLQTLAGKQK